jgi:anti-sigma regulatory factor (Ser/Thr protein kinase)
MTDPGQPDCGARFIRTDVIAAAEHAAGIRHEFSKWLAEYFALDRVKVSDIVLAINEALANAAESAYADVPTPGVMHVRADHDPTSDDLTVTVTDEGTWRPPAPRSPDSARGRGIPLMEALSDRVVIEPSDAGTRVCLQWHGITMAGAASDGQDCGSRTT